MMKKVLTVALTGVSFVAGAELLDRPSGIKIGTRMHVNPYVSLNYTYDSNTYSDRDHNRSSTWSVNPGASFSYNTDNLRISGNVFYRYHYYERRAKELSDQSYGENMTLSWATGPLDGRGWRVSISENYQLATQHDSIMENAGNGIFRGDRQSFQISGALQRNITDKWHADVNAGYYWMYFENDLSKFAPLYGWGRWNVGASTGYAFSKWTDLILSGTYSGYSQKNNHEAITGASEYSGSSRGWTIHGGIGTRATERLSYRLMAGWSHFEYSTGRHVKGQDTESDGITYSLSGNWTMSDTWHMMLLASSYYMPSEREYGSSMRVDSISWGLGHTMIKGKLNSTFDLVYRFEAHEAYRYDIDDYDQGAMSARFGLNYTLNRFLGVFGNFEYQTENQDSSKRAQRYEYDYDRWRLTVGLRLSY